MAILELIASFREDFSYNNLVYSFADIALEKIAGVSFGTFIHKEIFEPLGLLRTTIGPTSLDNVAKSYQTLDNCTSWRIPTSNIQDSTVIGATGGAKSTINDLLTTSGILSLPQTNSTSTKGSLFRELPTLVQNHILASATKPNGQFYGLGLVVTELPSALGLVGLNLPIVTRNCEEDDRKSFESLSQLQKQMDDAQFVGTPVKPLKSYQGRYYNSIGTFFIDVAAEGEQLRMWCRGYEGVDYNSYHYDHDIFAWATNRDHEIKMIGNDIAADQQKPLEKPT
ncbi:hypothetical protein G7Y89_g8670 [Cudoniella acicularis]|uniref:Beta-lactamase-related domain-containing protein n=1 Tax=Cudoniella acicularis TaxID=354080 RepID=A0A8H4RG64_9HELO|nr:hypothetical protein G7Y89_g8670 [Cudoniella acicularis]